MARALDEVHAALTCLQDLTTFWDRLQRDMLARPSTGEFAPAAGPSALTLAVAAAEGGWRHERPASPKQRCRHRLPSGRGSPKFAAAGDRGTHRQQPPPPWRDPPCLLTRPRSATGLRPRSATSASASNLGARCRGGAAPQATARAAPRRPAVRGECPTLLGATAGGRAAFPTSPSSGAKKPAAARRQPAAIEPPPSSGGGGGEVLMRHRLGSEVEDVNVYFWREFRCCETLCGPTAQAVSSRARPAGGAGVPGLGGPCLGGGASSLPELPAPAPSQAGQGAGAGTGAAAVAPLAGLRPAERDEQRRPGQRRPKSAGVTRRRRESAAVAAVAPPLAMEADTPQAAPINAEPERLLPRRSVTDRLCVIPCEAHAPGSSARRKSSARRTSSTEGKRREASELGSSREGSTCCSRSPPPSARNAGRGLKSRSFEDLSSSSSPSSTVASRRPRHTIIPSAVAALAKHRPESSLEEERQRARQVHHQLAVDGEVSCEDLQHAVRLLGHPRPNEEILAKIDVRRTFGRSFLDRTDFLQFCDSYQALHFQHMRARFESVDPSSSGAIGVPELCSLLELDGIRPLPSIVGSFLAAEFGLRKTWLKVTLPEYLRLYNIVQGRGGIVDADVATLKAACADPEQGISSLQVHGALSRLGFVVRPDVIKRLLVDVSGAPGRGLSQLEYLTFLRKYRDAEADRMVAALRARGHRDGDKVYADELSDVLRDLGHSCASPEAVREVLSSDVLGDLVSEVENLSNRSSGRCSCVFEHIFVLLESLRKSLGFLRSELEELKDAYEAYRAAGERAALAPGGSRLVELLSAFRLLGRPAPVWSLQSILDGLDLDARGRVEHGEFLRVAAELRKEELQLIQDRLDDEPVPRSRFDSLLPGLGYAPAAPAASSEDDGGSCAGAGGAPLDLWGAEALLKQHRALVSEQLRSNHGFSEDDVARLRQEFLRWAPPPGGEGAAGVVEPRGIAKLLARLFPGSTTCKDEHDRAKRLFQEAVADSKGELRFSEFLLLMRLHRDDEERARLEKELLAVKASEFTRAEIREFRAIFRGGLSQPEGHTMTVTDFVYVVARIVPVMGRAMERELHDLLSGLDADKDGTFGFGEFLLAMRQLVKQNWRGINEAASSLSGSAPEAAGPGRRRRREATEGEDGKESSAEEEAKEGEEGTAA